MVQSSTSPSRVRAGRTASSLRPASPLVPSVCHSRTAVRARAQVIRVEDRGCLMADTVLRVLVIGGQAEDVRAVDAGVRGLGLTVDWAEPAEAPARLDAGDILVVVLDLDATGLELG